MRYDSSISRFASPMYQKLSQATDGKYNTSFISASLTITLFIMFKHMHKLSKLMKIILWSKEQFQMNAFSQKKMLTK